MGVFPALGESNVRIAPSRAAASIRASLYLGVTDRDDFDVCHRRPCLASALTDSKTTEIACQVRFVVANDPKVLIVASSRTALRNWRRLARRLSILGAPSVLAPTAT